ncbi:uncharacterized protein LOC110396207 isoform X2 [Numida meleagris]|uniref:uncharacterized protein LOC110396207 isoform X2 n=1 Tax=Numida meleagris TaxID=8996 RepID=UPI000B3DFB2D|nr:uncharacterized protein LOC110396207 isoform X2 [Numida meleagris]
MAAPPPPALTAPHRAHAAPLPASPRIPRQGRPLASCSRSAPPGPAAPHARRRPSALAVPNSRRAAPPHPAPPGTEPPRRCRLLSGLQRPEGEGKKRCEPGSTPAPPAAARHRALRGATFPPAAAESPTALSPRGCRGCGRTRAGGHAAPRRRVTLAANTLEA